MLRDYGDIRLVGLAGAAGAGKDTLATLMVVDDWEHVAFADPLKDICVRHLGLSMDDVSTQEGKRRYNEFWGMTNREILQRVGTEAMRNGFDKDVWVKIMERKLTYMLMRGGKVLVTDCRFDNEAELIWRLGGVMANVVRGKGAGSPLTKAESGHASESGVSRNLIGFEVANDREIEHLRPEFKGRLETFTKAHATACSRIVSLCNDGQLDENAAQAVIRGVKTSVSHGIMNACGLATHDGIRLEFRTNPRFEANVVLRKGDSQASANVLCRSDVYGDKFRTWKFDVYDQDAWRDMDGSIEKTE